uniref:Transmembrane protein 255B n=1 Tax=Felis catus TaxID=9685 RepID=A0ABI7YDH4_FELCA
MGHPLLGRTDGQTDGLLCGKNVTVQLEQGDGKTSFWFVGSLLVASVCILTIGLAATTRTENVTVGGYYPGVILGFGAFLGIIGINLVENRKQMLVAAIVFISFGVVAAFCCAIVDGVFAARHIEPRPLAAGRCQFFASEVGYVHDAYQTEVCKAPTWLVQAPRPRGLEGPCCPSKGTAFFSKG